ncbi:MAG: hypothetical protein KAI27_02355 [Rhodospirillaceae bacterium]|nr:hypothetical protein [Rhodospirillaceae bacterium]
MATKPPTEARHIGSDAPKEPTSNDDPLSSSIALIDLLGKSGLILAPAMPEKLLIESVARKHNITIDQAMGAYRTIAGFGEKDIH